MCRFSGKSNHMGRKQELRQVVMTTFVCVQVRLCVIWLRGDKVQGFTDALNLIHYFTSRL